MAGARTDLPQGTLDMLVLRVLAAGRCLVSDSMADGLSERDARSKALAEFGSVEIVKDEWVAARVRESHSDAGQHRARLRARHRRHAALHLLAGPAGRPDRSDRRPAKGRVNDR